MRGLREKGSLFILRWSMTQSLVEGQFIKSNIDCGQNFPGSMVEHDNRVDTIRGCLKKIDKIANSFVLV